MKPKIDINSIEFKLAYNLIRKESVNALEADQTVEKAIVPIYDLPKVKAHQRKKRKLEQIGSGILLNIKDNYFVLTADHVFESIGSYALAISGLTGEIIKQFKGERYTSNNPKNAQKDIYDAFVYHIQDNLPDSIKKIAITLDQIDLSIEDENKPIYLVSGFRVSDSNTEGNVVSTKRKAYPSIEVEDEYYDMFNFPKESHIVLAYDNQILIDGNWQVSPKPRGMSGGGIMKVKGTKTSSLLNLNNVFEQKLTAIIIEHHKGIHNKPGVLVGTRLNVHLGLIYQFNKELFNDFLDEYYKNYES